MNDLCEKCGIDPIEYDSPGKWCRKCWAYWWSHDEESDMTEEEKDEYYEEVLKHLEKEE